MGLRHRGEGIMSMSVSDTPFSRSTRFSEKKICMGVTGSVACYKACDLLRALVKIQIGVSVTLSKGAREFVSPLLFSALGASRVYGDMFAPGESPFAHLEPGRSDNAFLIAPASANALANLAAGSASEMYSAQALAFSGPIVIAPAMNPAMWSNPATAANVRALAERKRVIVPPASGPTACGDEGQGRLAPLPEIFLALLKAISPKDLAGLKVMVTMGPTREPWDAVRFISNPSSGRMGAALATAAWLRGAEVTALCGPGLRVYLPQEIKKIQTPTARDMYREAKKIWPDMDWGLFCAAVGDFAPIPPQGAEKLKIHKSEGVKSISLEQNQDILAELSKNRKANQKTLGFAAEICPDMESLIPLARQKLRSKDADIIAANRVNPELGAFGAEEASMAVIDRDDLTEQWGPESKADIAWELCSWLLRI